MTGSLQIKNEKYYIVLSWKENEKRKQKWVPTGLTVEGNKRRAQTMLREAINEHEKAQQSVLLGEDQPFLPFMEQWIDEVQIHAVRSTTYDQYKAVFKNVISTFEPFQSLTVRQVAPRHIQSLYNKEMKRGISATTLRKYHTNLHKFFHYAMLLEIIDRNPTDRVTLPKKQPSRSGGMYTADQIRELFALFEGDVLETVVRLTATYGLRRSEVCGLRWDAIDFEKETLIIRHTAVSSKQGVLYADMTKTKSSCRTLPLTPTMAHYLKHVRAKQSREKLFLGESYVDSGYVCVAADGTPLTPNAVSMHYRLMIRKSKLPYIRFHDLRHPHVKPGLKKSGLFYQVRLFYSINHTAIPVEALAHNLHCLRTWQLYLPQLQAQNRDSVHSCRAF